MNRNLVTLVAVALLATACTLAPAQPGYSVNMPADLQAVIDAALADASGRTGLAPGRLKIASAQRVTWSDGSLGCPAPGMLYTQALVRGFRVQIRAGNDMLDYHAGPQGQPVLCPADRAIDPLPGGAI